MSRFAERMKRATETREETAIRHAWEGAPVSSFDVDAAFRAIAHKRAREAAQWAMAERNPGNALVRAFRK